MTSSNSRRMSLRSISCLGQRDAVSEIEQQLLLIYGDLCGLFLASINEEEILHKIGPLVELERKTPSNPTGPRFEGPTSDPSVFIATFVWDPSINCSFVCRAR